MKLVKAVVVILALIGVCAVVADYFDECRPQKREGRMQHPPVDQVVEHSGEQQEIRVRPEPFESARVREQHGPQRRRRRQVIRLVIRGGTTHCP